MNSVTAPFPRAGLLDEFRDLGGEIDKAGAGRLHRQQRRHQRCVLAATDDGAPSVIWVSTGPSWFETRERHLHEPFQILPLTSFCTRLAISTRRRQACSRDDIMRSMSRSLGNGISILGISILRSPSATFGSGGFQRSVFGSGSSILPGTAGLALRQFAP